MNIQPDIRQDDGLFEHVNINDAHDEQLTVGDKIADRVAATMGSWNFILLQSGLLILWIILNTIAFIVHWDSYPYILLNLALSFQAAFATPIILMSQNRQAAKDRLAAEHDYRVNVQSEQDIRSVLARLDQQDQLLEQKVELVLTSLSQKKQVRGGKIG